MIESVRTFVLVNKASNLPLLAMVMSQPGDSPLKAAKEELLRRMTERAKEMDLRGVPAFLGGPEKMEAWIDNNTEIQEAPFGIFNNVHGLQEISSPKDLIRALHGNSDETRISKFA